MDIQQPQEPAQMLGQSASTPAEPLIFTTRGNVPVSSLTHSVAWDVRDDYIHFAEFYRDADGVIVRQDAHVYAKQGAQILTAAGPQE